MADRRSPRPGDEEGRWFCRTEAGRFEERWPKDEVVEADREWAGRWRWRRPRRSPNKPTLYLLTALMFPVVTYIANPVLGIDWNIPAPDGYSSGATALATVSVVIWLAVDIIVLGVHKVREQ